MPQKKKVGSKGAFLSNEASLPFVSQQRIEELIDRRDRNKTMTTMELKGTFSEWIPFDR